LLVELFESLGSKLKQNGQKVLAGRNTYQNISVYNTSLLELLAASLHLQTIHHLLSSRSWFRASSIIKLNKNQLDAHLF
jgi:hypothetical protein